MSRPVKIEELEEAQLFGVPGQVLQAGIPAANCDLQLFRQQHPDPVLQG